MTNSLGTRIKYLRTISEMSQEELGRRVGVQRAAINKYEKGTVTNVPIQTIERIANVFEVSPTYLVGWDNDDPNPLAAEVRVLKGVSTFYGKDAVDLLEVFTNLSNQGKKKLQYYADDLSKIYTN